MGWTGRRIDFSAIAHSSRIKAAILAIDCRFRTPSLELKRLGASFGGANETFQSLGTQHGRNVSKAHIVVYLLVFSSMAKSAFVLFFVEV